MYSPFEDSGDDLLSVVCQLQIFFSLLSSIILKTDPDSPTMAVLLPILIAVPPVAAFIFESGLLDELHKCMHDGTTGYWTPCGRIMVGWRAKSVAALERLLCVQRLTADDEDGDDEPIRAVEGAGADVAAPPALASARVAHMPSITAENLSATAPAALDVNTPAVHLLTMIAQREGGKEELNEALVTLGVGSFSAASPPSVSLFNDAPPMSPSPSSSSTPASELDRRIKEKISALFGAPSASAEVVQKAADKLRPHRATAEKTEREATYQQACGGNMDTDNMSTRGEDGGVPTGARAPERGPLEA